MSIKIAPLVTPLASIFGSGFLIIAPILAAAVGKYAGFAMMAVCLLAYMVGYVIRHNIRYAEPELEKGIANSPTQIFEKVSDLALIPAYVISVVLYLKIMSSFFLDAFNLDTSINENIMISIILIGILIIALKKGLGVLEFLEKYALIVTLVIIAALCLGFLYYDINASSSGFVWPTMNEGTWLDKVKILAGTLIVVQGFETTRYLSNKFNRETRIKACRDSQLISSGVYIIFVFLTVPIMYNINLQGEISNNILIEVVKIAAPVLVIPLILAAILSQFSAAVADIFGASGNVSEVSDNRINLKKASLYIISAALLLTWIVSSGDIVSLASRAFAFYYMLQCIVALSVATTTKQKIFFTGLAIILFFITFYATPS